MTVSPNDVQFQLWSKLKLDIQRSSLGFLLVFFPFFVVFYLHLSAVRCDSHSALLHTHRHNSLDTNKHALLLNVCFQHSCFPLCGLTLTKSKSPCDEHLPKTFQIRSVTKLLLWLTRMINSRACTSGQSCLFMKWTVKRPSWLWYCETERERERAPLYYNSGPETQPCDLAVICHTPGQCSLYRWRVVPHF